MGSLFVMGAGASPRFPPQHATMEAAQTEVQHLVQRDPRTCGQDQTRWTLAGIRHACTWLQRGTLPGVHAILDRLHVVWKRARASMRSPDPAYDGTCAGIATLLNQGRADPRRCCVRFLDEVTIERQPTLATASAVRGDDQARASLSQRDHTLTRVVATLDTRNAQVCFRRANRITVPTLVPFSQDVRAAYPDVDTIDVVQDHWPVPTLPDLLVALAPQTTPYPFYRPSNWPTEPRAAAIRKWGQLPLPIQMVPLPTYASWGNPIEKRWRQMRPNVTHLHRWAGDLPRLREEVDRLLTRFAGGSADLLRSVGLSTGFNA